MNIIQRIGKQDMGLKWYRQVLFENKVQRRLSQYLAKKDSHNLIGDESLEGLVIDWHLAGAEMGFDNYVDEPVSNYEPTYAYA